MYRSDVDERTLGPMERLGLAYCRLESLEWDERAGEKPEGFDKTPEAFYVSHIQPQLLRIERILGNPYIERCRWVFDRRESEERWLEFREMVISEETAYCGHDTFKRIRKRQNTKQYSHGFHDSLMPAIRKFIFKIIHR
ncbi:MAG: hypothetical protein ACI4MM_05115 [Candidatus Ventricola sp.]